MPLCPQLIISLRMPFTVSHAAAVLPFRKLNLVWSAFIIGSMAPDFPYIIGKVDYRGFGHHFPAVVWFTIPAAFFALWMFHNVIKRPIVGMMPVGGEWSSGYAVPAGSQLRTEAKPAALAPGASPARV